MRSFLNKIIRDDGILFGAYMGCVLLGTLIAMPFPTIGCIIVGIGFICFLIFGIFNPPK